MPGTETRMLITGGSGFIGTNAVEYFLNLGYRVLNIDIKQPQQKKHLSLWSQTSILDIEQLRKISLDFQPHYILHLAARTDLNEKQDLNEYAANIEGVKNIIRIANECELLRRIVFSSSRMVCRIDYIPQNPEDYCPPNLYGKSKVLTEQIIRESEINAEWLIVRPTSIWGPWFDVPYKIFFETIAKKMYFNISGFNPIKSFGFVYNTIYQIDKLMYAPTEKISQKTFYLCDYPPLRVNNWADIIRQGMKLPSIRTIPYRLITIGAYIGDLLMSLGINRFPITTFRLDNLITDMVYDTSDLEAICGSLPFSLEEGVRITVDWMKQDMFSTSKT
jgi:nucleoside-diphosphate-sugar epimerase